MANIHDHGSGTRWGSTDGRNYWDANDHLSFIRDGNQVYNADTWAQIGTWHGDVLYSPSGARLSQQVGKISYDPLSRRKLSELY